jgi:hypothetical protein
MNIGTIGLLFALLCAGCGSQLAISGKERTEYLRSIKPYGAHWVKEGMTRVGRLHDFMGCGGATDLSEGLPRNPKITSQEFFAQFKEHVNQLAACMRGEGYEYHGQCDARCLHP